MPGSAKVWNVSSLGRGRGESPKFHSYDCDRAVRVRRSRPDEGHVERRLARSGRRRDQRGGRRVGRRADTVMTFWAVPMEFWLSFTVSFAVYEPLAV